MSDIDAQEFSRKFPKLANALADINHFPMSVYAQFERILGEIEQVWGTLAGHTYLEELLMTHRSDRKGFSDPIATELMRLHLLHIQEYPERHSSPNDPFGQIR